MRRYVRVVLRVQKKLERHFLYRFWVLIRASAWIGWVALLIVGLIPWFTSHDISPLTRLGGTYVAFAVVWKTIEAFAERALRWFFAKKPKKLPKGEEAPKLPPVRIFYRSTSLGHLIPGKSNPVLLALSEQDLEYSLWFRLYLTLRFVGYVVVGLLTLMLLSTNGLPAKGGLGDGIALIFVPFFALRIVESSILYLFLGSVMSGDDIHGAKTTRFFAFEPSFSFVKKLTLPVFDGRAWFVSLHPIRQRAFRVLWWLLRITYVLTALFFAQVANDLKNQTPRVIPFLLSVSFPLSIFFIGLIIERAVGYLAFFPAQKQSKKKGAAIQPPPDLQKVG